MRKILFWLIVLSMLSSGILKTAYANPDYICRKSVVNSPCEYDENRKCWIGDKFLKDWYTIWWNWSVWGLINGVREITIEKTTTWYHAYINGNYFKWYDGSKYMSYYPSDEISNYYNNWVKWSVTFSTMEEWFNIFNNYMGNFRWLWELWYYQKVPYRWNGFSLYTYSKATKDQAIWDNSTYNCCYPWDTNSHTKKCVWTQTTEVAYYNLRTTCESGYTWTQVWEHDWDSWREWEDYVSHSQSCEVVFGDYTPPTEYIPTWMIGVDYIPAN